MTPSAVPFTPLVVRPAGSLRCAARPRPHTALCLAVAVSSVVAVSGLRSVAVSSSPAAAPAPVPSTALSPAAGSSLVVITKPGQAARVAAGVQARGGQVTRRLESLDTLVVSGVASTAIAGDPAVLSVSANGPMSGRSAGWGEADGSTSDNADLPGFGSTPTATNTFGKGGGSGSSDGSVLTPASVTLASAEDSIRARWAWSGSTGRGVDVALIDTGIAPVAGLTGAGKVLNGPDLSYESQAPERRYVDNNGHGTHLAGIIAGNDLDTGASATTLRLASSAGKVSGIAPGARLVNVKVGDGNGVTDVSQVLAAIDWVVQHAHDPQGPDGKALNIRVLNLSFGTDSAQPATIDPLAHAAEVAWRSGIVVVTSAGNAGSTLGRLTNPAIDPYVLAVGADDTAGTRSTSDDTVADFSSRGDGVRNPDVVAPGVHIASLRQPGGVIDQAYGGAGSGVPGSDRFIRGSGTSQAAAVVSGSAALLIGARPQLTPDQVKALLVRTAHGISGDDASASGAGVIDLYRAMSAWVSNSAQNFPRATGTGSLDAARGSSRPSLDGVSLNGEQDIFAQPYDSATMASAREQQAAWNGGAWNGSSWAGSSWAGSSWAGSSWAGSSWAGSSWAGSSWAGSSWAGSSWAGTSWAGSAWAGASWN